MSEKLEEKNSGPVYTVGDNATKEYLGDSVYARRDTFGSLVLTTENSYPNDPSNTIVFDPSTLQSLMEYLYRVYPKAMTQMSDRKARLAKEWRDEQE